MEQYSTKVNVHQVFKSKIQLPDVNSFSPKNPVSHKQNDQTITNKSKRKLRDVNHLQHSHYYHKAVKNGP